jgi:hypothetical protein
MVSFLVKKLLFCVALMLSTTRLEFAEAYSVQPPQKPSSLKNMVTSRRSMFLTMPSLLLISAAPSISNALDMDAFIQSELKSETCNPKVDKKCAPKLSEDEALCKYGQPSAGTGAACLRAGMPTTRASGVDVFGKGNRGDYVRCKVTFVDGPSGKLEKQWNCK